ncbi:MAG: hypothetical protein ACOCV4_07000 [Myxococcota bacterium]
MRLAWACAAVPLLLAGASSAEARARGPADVAILPFDGPGADQAERQVRRALRSHGGQVRVVPAGRVRGALAGTDGESPSDEDFVDLSRQLEASALVTGRVARRGRRWIVRVEVRNGADGATLEDTVWRDSRAGRLTARVGRQAWARLGAAFTRAEPAEPAEPASRTVAGQDEEVPPALEDDPSEGERTPTDSTDSEDGAPGSRPQAVRLSAGLQLLSRRFDWSDDLFGVLSSYELKAAPAAVIDATWFPGAHFTDGAFAHVGLHARYVRAFGLQSEPSINREGTSFDTRADQLEVGLTGRIPLGKTELGVDAEYGRYRFDLQVPEDVQRRPLTDADYQSLRFGAALSYEADTWFRLDLELAYLFLIDMGEIATESWFPRADGGGVNGRVVAAFPIDWGLEVRVAAELNRFFFDLDPRPGDPWIAGGAVDQAWALGLEVGWRK